jgi:hypothetical protein
MLALGCTYGQGYFFARPTAADDVPAIIGDAARERPSAATAREAGAPEGRAMRLPRPAPSVDASPA